MKIEKKLLPEKCDEVHYSGDGKHTTEELEDIIELLQISVDVLEQRECIILQEGNVEIVDYCTHRHTIAEFMGNGFITTCKDCRAQLV